MRSKALQTRRQKNRKLGEQDAANRCDHCRRPFAETGTVVEDFLRPGKFCSRDCLEAKFEGVGR